MQSANWGSKVWRPAVAALGLAGVHVHDLRHCAATSVATLPGASTKDVQVLLGHRTATMALRYTQSSAARQAELAEAAAQLRLAPVTALRTSS